MHMSTWASWSFLACVGPVAVAVAASTNSGTVEVDLVFPRNNTYAPTPLLPIIFAFQNSELAPFLNPTISFTVWDRNNMSNSVITANYDVRWANFSSSDPYFVYRSFAPFDKEGTWALLWTVTLDSCTNDTLNSPFSNDPIVTNITNNHMIFTTQTSAQEVDLVAATGDDNCPADAGVAVSVTDTLDVSSLVNWSGGDKCAVVASSPPTPDPCRVSIDSAAASSISASMTATACKSIVSPVGISCPAEDEGESAAQRLVIGLGGVACLAAGVGTILYILV